MFIAQQEFSKPCLEQAPQTHKNMRLVSVHDTLLVVLV